MADKKISQLTPDATLAGTEEFPFADGGVTKKILATDLTSQIAGMVPPGLDGRDGAPGTTGATGPSGGPTGATGPAGQDGLDGAPGNTGPAGGPTGATGTSGPPGLDGLDGAPGISTGGGWFSPVDAPPASPNAFDDEFTSSGSLSGWTAFGQTNTVTDINTTVPGRLYVHRNANIGGAKTGGYYKAISTSGTYLVKCGATNARENYHRGNVVCILPTGAISDSSPVVQIGQFYVNGLDIVATRMSDLSTYATTVFDFGSAGTVGERPAALYVKLKFNSATSVDIDISHDGIAWMSGVTAYNPGWNMDKIGWGVSEESGTTYPVTTSWDYFRKIA